MHGDQERLNRQRRSQSGEASAEKSASGGEFDVKECRRPMQKHHPDKGGDPALFRLWRARFEAAKAAQRCCAAIRLLPAAPMARCKH
jgi:hypothetical protein